MILYSPFFSVSLVTIHEPLNKVSRMLNTNNIYRTIKNTIEFSEKVYGESSKIAVCSFNPHGGEGGYLGKEEELIREAIDKIDCRYLSKDIYAADTLFYKVARKEFNAVVCMYHDQGLIPFKMNNFETGVNITYGIDIIRTSPDHGTAFDITGRGEASILSFVNAYNVASSLV
jgi:4-hydroxythreonine-4-phosphate dehydrogenase